MYEGGEEFLDTWLRFEREFGTLEQLTQATTRCTQRLAQIQEMRQKEQPLLSSAPAQGAADSKRRPKRVSTQHENKRRPQPPKRKRVISFLFFLFFSLFIVVSDHSLTSLFYRNLKVRGSRIQTRTPKQGHLMKWLQNP